MDARKTWCMPVHGYLVGCEMSENYKMRKIGVTALCRISAKGGEGIYLYIPKNFADVYGIVGADYAEVVFGKIFYESSEVPDKPKLVDLRSRSRKGKKGLDLKEAAVEEVEVAGGDDFERGYLK
jgi:hypothetical protein